MTGNYDIGYEYWGEKNLYFPVTEKAWLKVLFNLVLIKF